MDRFCIKNLYFGIFVSLLFYNIPLHSETTINLGWEANVRSFDPRNNVDANSQYLESLVHCSLIEFDTDGNSISYLSDSQSWDKTGTKLTVSLKKNVKYSNGQILVAKDVVATYKSLSSDPSFARHSAFKDLVDIKEVNDHQIIFSLSKPDATFISNLIVGILPAKLASNSKIVDQSAVGCGPYTIATTDVNGLELVPNSHYTLGKIPTNKIAIKIVKSEKTRLAKLRTGELDIVQNLISRDIVKTIEKKYPELKIEKKSALKTTYLGFNMRDKILGNKLVRQAIAQSIDRQPIIDHILGGLALPATTMLPPNSRYFNENLTSYNFNIPEANKLLDKAGFPKKGKYRFSLSYKTTTDSTRIQIARAIASQLKAVGIEVKVETMEWGRFQQDVAEGRVQMWGLTWIGFKDPDILRFAFATESMPPNGGNRGFYSNPELDKLLEKGRTTSDFKVRKNLYNEIQNIIADQSPYVFLWHEVNFAVLNSKISGFNLYADGRFNSLMDVVKK